MTLPSLVVLTLLFIFGYAAVYHNIVDAIPLREHRGVWIATVDNIDWPLSPTYSVLEQKSQLKYLIGQIHLARLNAVYFQVFFFSYRGELVKSVNQISNIIRYAQLVTLCIILPSNHGADI